MASLDSSRSPVDLEKTKLGDSHYESVDFDDPDAGLSDEERAAIVRIVLT